MSKHSTQLPDENTGSLVGLDSEATASNKGDMEEDKEDRDRAKKDWQDWERMPRNMSRNLKRGET